MRGGDSPSGRPKGHLTTEVRVSNHKCCSPQSGLPSVCCLEVPDVCSRLRKQAGPGYPPAPCARTPGSRNQNRPRRIPPGVEREPVDGLPIATALDPLQHHHHGHDHRRHTAASHVGEQVSEHLIREQREALPVQHPVDRVRRDPALAVADRRAQQITLFRRQPQRRRELPRQTMKSVATTVPKRLRQPCRRHAKDTSDLGRARANPLAGVLAGG